jgi:HTH-type transcriptional regulator/antitoxin HigA
LGSLVDVRKDFGHAGIVGRRTVFNIHGNDYRLIASQVNYKTKRCLLCTFSPTLSRAKETGTDEYNRDSRFCVRRTVGEIPASAHSFRSRTRTADGDAFAVGRARGSFAEEEALAEVLTLLIENHEEKYHPLPRVSPNESLQALMEERGLKHKDIWPVLGNKGAATEVLSGRRSISKAQAKRLAEFFHVPVDLFV